MIGQEINRFVITEEIGSGGMGAIYLGQHKILKTKAAFKILHSQFLSNREVTLRFRREAEILGKLNHPNIARVYDYIEDSVVGPIIVMEYLEGIDLENIIRKKGHLADGRAHQFLRQMLDAMDYAHKKEIYHRDIKPSNIFIIDDRHVKIIDFGIARDAAHTSLTTPGAVMGTYSYMSPEQFGNIINIDNRSDIFSIGATLYFMLNGKSPFQSNTAQEIIYKILNQPNPKFTTKSELEGDYLKACDKMPENRFNSCQEWIKSLDRKIFDIHRDPTILEPAGDEDEHIEYETAHRNTDNGLRLKIVSKIGQTIGSFVYHFNSDYPVDDGDYYYSHRGLNFHILVKSGQIKKRYYIEAKDNIHFHTAKFKQPENGDLVTFSDKEVVPDGKYRYSTFKSFRVKKGKIIG
jgi:serine/threonine protein kinase